MNEVLVSEASVVNCSSEHRELRLLLQCPQGAIPVGKGSFYTRSVDIAVPAFDSKRVVNHFYFPRAGQFMWFPAHALADERLVAFETTSPALQVVEARGAVDADWERSRRAGITSVPTFVAAQQRIVGAQPYEALEALVRAAGAQARQGNVVVPPPKRDTPT